MSKEFDVVKNPSHYCEGRKYEPIDVFNNTKMFFSIGNASKYLSRAGRKYKDKTIEDLNKAIFYLEYEKKHKGQIRNSKLDYEYVENVLEDWNLSTNITKALRKIFQYIDLLDVKLLTTAIKSIKDEISELK